MFVVVGISGGVTMRSTNNHGASWTNVVPPPGDWYSVVFGNNIFYARSSYSDGKLMISKDYGLSWTMDTKTFPGSIIACGGTTCIEVDMNSGAGNATILIR